MSSAPKQTLEAILTLFLTSKERVLTQGERAVLKRFCAIFLDGVRDRPICSLAMREFADEVSGSGLLTEGKATDLGALLTKAKSLKFLVG